MAKDTEPNTIDIESIVVEESGKVVAAKVTTEESIVVAPAEEEKKKEEKQKQRVDFLGNNFTTDFFKKHTNDKSDESLRNEEKEEIKADEPPPAPNPQFSKSAERIYAKENYPSADDLRDVAGLLMEFFDTGASMVCGAIAGEKQISQFEVPAPKREKLTTLLSEILAKHQVAMSLEMLFFVLVVLIYSKPVAKALEIKRKKKLDGAEPGIKLDNSETVEDNKDDNKRFTEEEYKRATRRNAGK